MSKMPNKDDLPAPAKWLDSHTMELVEEFINKHTANILEVLRERVKENRRLNDLLADRERRAQPAPGAEAWQPIETAPRNRSLLLCVAGTPVPIYCGRYRTGNLGEPQPSQAAWRCDSSGRFANPTHWQPLPAPPVAAHEGLGTLPC